MSAEVKHGLGSALAGEILHHFEIYVGGLTLRTSNGTILNVFNRFWIEGFDGDKPRSMIGGKIVVEEQGDRITIAIAAFRIHIGMDDDDWSGPEAWLLKMPDGTLVVENGT